MRVVVGILLVLAVVTGCHSARSAGPSTDNRPAFTYFELQALLLNSNDLPVGYVPTGDVLTRVYLCDRVVADTEKAATVQSAVYVSSTAQGGLFEDLYSFSSTSGASRLVKDFRSLPACASSENPVTSPAFGEDVVTSAISSPTGLKYDIGLVRSGSTVMILSFSVKHGSINASTWHAILQAAEAKLLGT
jgi:hypothetical protein